MQKKSFSYLIISISIIIISSIIVISYFNLQNNKQEKLAIETEKITDECTKEWSEYVASLNNSTHTNSSEERVSPNAKIFLIDYYKSCGHTEETVEIAAEGIVNLSKQQLKEKYAGYDIKNFVKEEIKLYKEIDGLCDKHYLLIEEEGCVDIYKLENNGDKRLLSKTNISSEYLTEADKIQLKQGIYVYGEEELNKTLEDFE